MKFFANPAVIAAIVSTAISAAVAMIVVVADQNFSERQQRIQLLTPKLEELHLLVHEFGEHNDRMSSLFESSFRGDSEAKKELQSMDDGFAKLKRIELMINLYFPDLTSTYLSLFVAKHEQAINILFHLSFPSEGEERYRVFAKVNHIVGLMLQEIINNRERLRGQDLTQDYRRTPQEKIENIPQLISPKEFLSSFPK